MKTIKFNNQFTFPVAILLVLISLVSACTSEKKDNIGADGKLEGSITISGAFALYPLVNVWAEEFRKEYPNVKFNISAGGAGKGMTDVIYGSADLAMYSKDISQIEIDKGAFGFSVTKDAVLPVINKSNPVLQQILAEGLTQVQLTAYFLNSEESKWKNSQFPVHVYTRSDASGAAEVWAKYLGGSAQEELKGIAVFGDPGLADAVKNDVNGIGYNNVIYVYDVNTGQKYDGIDVAPIDVNANGKLEAEENFYGSLDEISTAIADGRYPSPPARELFLVSKGKPTSPLIIAFINWVLTSGQSQITANGYINLDQEIIDRQLLKLK